MAASIAETAETYDSEKTEAQPGGDGGGEATGRSPLQNEPQPASTLLPAKGGALRPAHYGLEIQFEDHPEDTELGRLVESTVWVNRSHPAYRRALVSRSVGYHIALAVAMALAPLAAESAHEHAFVTAFLSRWGEAIEQKARRTR